MAQKRPQKNNPLKERSDCYSVNCSITTRKLSKTELAGVIFGCTHETQEECFSRNLFGLPFPHLVYVKNIVPGMPIFLFNYIDRKLHGIFEATTYGQLELDPYGWTKDKLEKTCFPAQVRVKSKMQCRPLPEKQYMSIIKKNYYNRPIFFWFELDQDQTKGLISLFSSSSFVARSPRMHDQWHQNNKNKLPADDHAVSNIPPTGGKAVVSIGDQPHAVTNSHLDALGLGGKQPPKKWSSLFKTPPSPNLENPLEDLDKSGVNLSPNLSTLGRDSSSLCLDEENQVLQGVEVPENGSVDVLESLESDVTTNENVHFDVPENWETLVDDLTPSSLVPESSIHSQDCAPDLESVITKVELVITKLLQITNEIAASQLETKKISSLEHDLVHSKQDIRELKVQNLIANLRESIYIVGGFDGKTWYSDLDLYSPSRDSVKSLQPMNCVRPYASAVKTIDGLYVMGGLNSNVSFNTVELYNPINNQWVGCSSLNREKGFVGGVSINNQVYAIGGGNRDYCFSDVEVLDPNVGSWIFIQPMLEKRSAPAVAEINGILYVAGGYDGSGYLKSVERYDPRESLWTRIASMNEKRGCHNLAVVNDKLYAMGGYNVTNMHSSVEVFDPRLSAWMTKDPMNSSRGNFGAVTIGNKIYTIGGLDADNDFVHTVECYTENEGWEVTELNGIGRRCDFSAVLAMQFNSTRC